ncbi:MAG: hypothetical protein BWY67_00841 [Bacteroidetes bacterium ADurb.Bin397]|nr:MAG: hypothetical protein BWY67_00841 [Bacteroidetes bacterium ADurb.Bin397]
MVKRSITSLTVIFLLLASMDLFLITSALISLGGIPESAAARAFTFCSSAASSGGITSSMLLIMQTVSFYSKVKEIRNILDLNDESEEEKILGSSTNRLFRP